MASPQRRETGDMALDLYIEVAEGGACMGHIPSLPGFCVRAASVNELEGHTRRVLSDYVDFLAAHDAANLNSTTAKIVDAASAGRLDSVSIRERERVFGAPVWESGNAAALFSIDRRLLSSEEVDVNFRFVRVVLNRMRAPIEPLSSDQRGRRPALDRRSLDETLEHIGNCVWWFASRIDDSLPEPDEIDGEDPLDRIDQHVVIAREVLLSVPLAERSTIYIPKRFPTLYPREPWTHAKACRREAEHVWAHWRGAGRDQRSARP